MNELALRRIIYLPILLSNPAHGGDIGEALLLQLEVNICKDVLPPIMAAVVFSFTSCYKDIFESVALHLLSKEMT